MTAWHKLRLELTLGIAIFAILSGSQILCGAEGVRSVRQMIDIKNSWPLFAETGTSFVIQGHLGSRTNDELHMRHCRELRFFLKRSETMLPRRPRGETMYQLTGKFTMRGKAPVFEVDKIETASSFVQQHRARSVAMNFRNPAEWRKLAASTKAEAIFNESTELHGLARDALEEACRIERSAKKTIADKDMAGWIAEMRQFGIGEDVLDLWEHERLRMKWTAIRSKRDPNVMLRFAHELAKSFPESRTPLELPQPKLDESYRKNPQQLFSESDEDRRKRLLRLFYMNVTRTEILMNADPKGGNADNILDRLKAALPDDPDLITHYEDLGLKWRFSQLPQASREAAIELSQEYRVRKLPEKARETLEIWLEARLGNWRKEGPRGLVRAAEEYQTLLEDEQAAHELLLKAWKLAPGEPDTKSALEKLGYRLHSQRWITEKEFDKLPPDPTEEAIKSGIVLRGMTAKDVKRVHGIADEVRTSLSAGQVSQAWVYGESGKVRTVIHLLRSSRHPVDQARVIAIGEIRPRRIQKVKADEEISQERDEN